MTISMWMRVLLISFVFLSAGCEYYVSSDEVSGVAGVAGAHTQVAKDTQGNMLGYYEYLPLDFSENKKFPIVFFWNGANAISGNGKEELLGLLTQGLPEYINQGKDFPFIIVSGQMIFNDWRVINIHSFVEYVLNRYKDNIDIDKVYMTGFSAGGGLTMRYALQHPEMLTAIVPVAPAIRYPHEDEPSEEFAALDSWFIHNRGDEIVSPQRSVRWYEALKGKGAEHRLSIYEDEGHYAWYKAYATDSDMWRWLLSKSK